MSDSTTQPAEAQDWDVHLVRNAAHRAARAARAVEDLAPDVARAGRAIGESLRAGGTVLVCGNGGSAACAQHFAAEFTGRLALDRRPLPAVSLTVDTSAMTAIANDYGYDAVFARQVRALGRPGDVLVAMSTSGTSSNVRLAVEAAVELGLTVISLTGPTNGLGGHHEVCIPLRETARIQEAHDLVLHELAQIAERVALDDLDDDASADRYPFLLTGDQLEAFAAWMRRSEQALVTTNGVFDLLHEGHLSSLRQAAAHGDRLVAILNADDSVARLKGPSRPVQPLTTRILALHRAGVVDHVVVMSGDDPVADLERLRPAVHVKGAEYRERPMPERAVVEGYGGRVEYVELEPGISTTQLVERMSQA